MKRPTIFLLLALLGASCTPADPHKQLSIFPTDRSFSEALQPGTAIAVIGITASTKRTPIGIPSGFEGGWIRINPTSRERIGDSQLTIDVFGSIFPSSAIGGTRYDAYTLPAGTYSLAWLHNGWADFFLADFAQVHTVHANGRTYRTFSSRARAKPDAPSFTIAPGEVVYMGDLVLDVSNDKQAMWSVKRSDDATVRKLFVERGFTNEPVVRLLRRADGSPVEGTRTVAAAEKILP